MVTLFINGHIRKQPKCPPGGEWINKMWDRKTQKEPRKPQKDTMEP